MTAEIVQATRDFFRLLGDAGIPDRTVMDGPNRGLWLPLAAILRTCGYRAPKGQNDPLEHIQTRKMLIGGKLTTCIETSDFARNVALHCTAPEALQFAVAYLNFHLHAAAKRFDPQLGAMLASANARVIVIDGEPMLALIEPGPEDELRHVEEN
jgi:hypothetical protein